MKSKTDFFPEINALSLKDARAALNLGELNRDGIKDEYLPEYDARLNALRERVRRLEWTTKQIEKLQSGP